MRPFVLVALPLALAAPALAQDWQEKKEEALRYFADAFSGRSTSNEGGDAPGDPAAASDAEELRHVVVRLFEAYEREDVGAFLQDLAPSFTTADRTGNDYRLSDMGRALSDDFAILDRIDFEVKVDQPLVQRDGRRIQVDARWSRRAIVQVGGAEWILTDQRTTFVFEPGGGRILLGRIFGDAIFGLARRNGNIVANDGTIDGERIGQPVVLDRTTGVLGPVAANDPQSDPGSGPGPGPGPGTPGPGSTTIQGTFTINAVHIDFDSQSTSACIAPALANADFEFGCTPAQIVPLNGAGIQRAAGPLSTITAAPQGGYSGGGETIAVGRTYFFITGLRRYGAFEIVSADGVNFTVAFKYQPNGTTDLK